MMTLYDAWEKLYELEHAVPIRDVTEEAEDVLLELLAERQLRRGDLERGEEYTASREDVIEMFLSVRNRAKLMKEVTA